MPQLSHRRKSSDVPVRLVRRRIRAGIRIEAAPRLYYRPKARPEPPYFKFLAELDERKKNA